MRPRDKLLERGYRIYHGYVPYLWHSSFPSDHLIARHSVSGRTVSGLTYAELLAKIEKGTEVGVNTEGCEREAPAPPNEDEGIWKWLGEEHRSKDWICKLVATAEDESLGWEERQKAFDRLASFREREAEKVRTAPFHFEGELFAPKPGQLIFDPGEEGLRKAKKRGKQKDTTRAVRVTRDGEAEWGGLRNDEVAIREFMDKRATELGYESLDHLAQRKRGRQREDLAMVAREAVGAGAKQAAIGRVIGRGKSTMTELLASLD